MGRIGDRQEFAKAASKRVLIAGLGLGLLASQLIKNPKVTEIVVIEKNPDVIKLISKYLNSSKIKIIEIDYLDYLSSEIFKQQTSLVYGDTNTVSTKNPKFDYAIIDLWVADENTSAIERQWTIQEMKVCAGLTKLILNFTGKVWVWGLNDKELNPAFYDSPELQAIKKSLINSRP